ncbi:MAG: DUF2961 domain-containing protein [Planctomycetia bacterium]|nr:DUF2961 domain-containing protein [Planctomycetia bacterium]
MLCQPPAQPTAITWHRLLQEQADLSSLTELSPYPYQTFQFSSYDRDSITASRPDKWFANHDRGQCLYEGTVEQETPYYSQPPQRGSKPSGTLPAGTRIGIARHKRNVPGYIWVYSFDGPGVAPLHSGYIASSSWTPLPQGPVLADISGSGCITRFWSSNPGEAGKVRIYLDDQPVPIVDTRLIDLLRGEWEYLNEGQQLKLIPAPWACEKGRGYELVFPITFQKRCLIAVEKPSLQWQIQYRRYADDTPVQTVSLAELVQKQKLIHELGDKLTSLTGKPPQELAFSLGGLQAGDKPDVKQAVLPQSRLEPGESKQLHLLEEPGANPSRAIVQFEVSIQADRMIEALRRLKLTISFDDASLPQVESPLGDYFATAPGANPLATLPLRVTASGKMSSYWVMPYARHATIKLSNLDDQPISIQMNVTHVPYNWIERSLYFHANWRCNAFNTRPPQDWLVLSAQGQGHIAGQFISVHNPVKEWWGEGDTKVTIDGAKFPSLWGTGTEDDMGLGFADRTVFSHPWRAQPRHDGKGHEGFTSLLRARNLDRISFSKSLNYVLEVRHDQPGVQVQYASTIYWYARPDAKLERQELNAAVLRESLPGGQP